MRPADAYETADGVLHRSERDAKRHAEARYADAMLRLARMLAHVNYTRAAEIIDAHLPEFAALAGLRADCKAEPRDGSGFYGPQP